MKKTLPYIATAVLLGAVLMLAPVWLFPVGIPYGVAPDQYSPFAETAQRLKESPGTTEALFGIRANQPTDAIFVSFMVTISLVFALGASQYLKRRTPSA